MRGAIGSGSSSLLTDCTNLFRFRRRLIRRNVINIKTAIMMIEPRIILAITAFEDVEPLLPTEPTDVEVGKRKGWMERSSCERIEADHGEYPTGSHLRSFLTSPSVWCLLK